MSKSTLQEIHPNSIDCNAKYRRSPGLGLYILVTIFICLFSGCDMRKYKVYQAGILSGLEPFQNITDGFKEKMTELGYIEGENIEYDYWQLNDEPIEEEKVIQKFIEDDVDFMLVFPSRPAKLAKALTLENGIPVIFAGASIEGIDLVQSQQKPGGNITGVRYPTPEMTAKRLELLVEIAPHVKRVLLIFDGNYPSYIPARKSLDDVAGKHDIIFVENQVASLDDVKFNLEELDKSDDIGIDAIFMMPDLITGTMAAWEVIEAFAIKHNLPVIGTLDYTLQGAGLFMLNCSHHEIGRLSAVIADKILRDTPPESIPVITPNMDLYINYRQSQVLGLTIPGGLLKQAKQVIR
ncbi:MAG: ABC transporter substrate-binding protein [Anaerolineales bacterium]|nr:ABC transporter substrate-binding protein [Anaerolineales bacterium]